MRATILAVALLVAFQANAQQSTFATCMRSYSADEKLKPINEKVVLHGRVNEPPFAMLTDQSIATETEKSAIAAFVEVYTTCFKQDAAWFDAGPPEGQALIRAAVNGFVGLAASLYTGELTFGQFNRERSDRATKLNAAMADLGRRFTDRAQAEEQARRNAALQYLLSQPRPMPTQGNQIPTPQQPTTTNCHRFGAQVTCTTR